MILFRCLAWDKAASPTSRGGPLWFPRMLQGNGRHDNPDLYGCLYVSVEPVSAVAEQIQRLAGTSLEAPDLVRRGLPLALATVDFDENGDGQIAPNELFSRFYNLFDIDGDEKVNMDEWTNGLNRWSWPI